MTCNLIVPKQPVDGIISIDIKSEKILAKGDTDISGSMELAEKFKVFVRIFVLIDPTMNKNLFQVPRPILLPDYGPSAGGTKIRMENLSFDNTSDLLSTMKAFLGKNQCHITEYD